MGVLLSCALKGDTLTRFFVAKQKPCSVLVTSLRVAGLSARLFLELSCLFSLRAVTSGLDDAIAAF